MLYFMQSKIKKEKMKMIFKATEEQVKQIAANAVNASKPMGMGFLHYTNRVFTNKDFNIDKFGLNLDYVQGRMVKLNIKHKGDNQWQIIHGEPTYDYQSWINKYPTNQDLVNSVLKK